jgi:signal transduction histidine kinase
MKRSILAGVLFIAAAGDIAALEPVLLDPVVEEQALGTHIEILEDESGTLRVEDVRKAISWKQGKSMAPNFGFTKSAIWARFRIQNPGESTARILDISWDLVDDLQLYGFQGESLSVSAHHGRALPFRQRPVNHREFLLPLQLASGQTEWYVRLQSTGPLTLPMTLRSSGNMIARADREALFYGAIYGILAILAVYNLFLYLAVRDPAYLFYSIFVLLFVVTEFHNKGFAFQYFWPEWLWSSIRTSSALRWLEIITSALFFRSFVRTSVHSPRLDRILKAIMVMAAAGLAALPLLGIREADLCGIVFFILSGLFVLISSVSLAVRGNRQATIYLMAFAAVILGAIATSLRSTGFLPFHFLTAHSISIGSVIQAAILSLGLADRYRQMREEATAARLKLATDRIEISRDLHDVLGSDLGEIVLQAESTEQEMQTDTVAFLARRSLTRLRDIVRLLKLNTGDLGELSAHVEQYLDRLRLTGRFALTANIETQDKLPDFVNLQMQRIFLEWMANVVRHSGASRIHVALRERRGILSLFVVDNGTLFEWDGSPSGSGLSNIADRALSIHARLGARRRGGFNFFRCRLRIPRARQFPEGSRPDAGV